MTGRGACQILFFATVNDYDYLENRNEDNIRAAVAAAEQIASMSCESNGAVYHPQVRVIGFDGGSTDRKILSRIPPEDFNRCCETYNEALRSAVRNSAILKENAPRFITVPEIMGGKAAFISDGLHYDDRTLVTLIRALCS